MEKEELLKALELEHEKMLDALDGLPDGAMLQPGVNGEWTIKDLLAHLSNWEAELIKLLWQLKQGQRPTTVHFRGQSVDELNAAWQQQNKERPLERVLEDFEGVRSQTIRRVESFSDRQLNDPHSFRWLKDEPLWRWIANDSYEHEAEHRLQVEAWREREGI